MFANGLGIFSGMRSIPSKKIGYVSWKIYFVVESLLKLRNYENKKERYR